jgi:CRP-like cAMP-binding protein
MEKSKHTPEKHQGHSHNHLHHLLENQVSMDPWIDELSHQAHHHNQELSYCPLFKGMSQGEHDQFLDRNVKEVLTYKKGETIVLQGEPIHSVMLLVQGSVRTQMITREGNVLNIDILEAVIPLAPAFIYGVKKSYPVDVIAAEPCVFLKISKDAWLDEMANNKQLLTNFLTMNADLTFFLTNKLQMISLKSLRKKLATFFLEKTTVEKDTFTLKRSRTQLAEYFGVQRQSLARSMKEMEDDGIILLKRRTVKILDRNKLARE